MCADANTVGILKLPPVDFLLIDERPVGATEVLQKQYFLYLGNARMVARDRDVFQTKIVIALSPDRKWRMGDLDLLNSALRCFHEERG